MVGEYILFENFNYNDARTIKGKIEDPKSFRNPAFKVIELTEVCPEKPELRPGDKYLVKMGGYKVLNIPVCRNLGLVERKNYV